MGTILIPRLNSDTIKIMKSGRALSPRLWAIIALLVTSIIWGLAGPVIKLTIPFLPPFTFLLYRFLIASFIILPFYLRELKKKPLHPADYPRLFWLGFFGMTLNLGLLFLGFEKTSAIEGSLISAATPIMIIFAGWKFLKERVTKREEIGTTLALLGTIIIATEPIFNGGGNINFNPLEHLEGNFLIFIANFAWVVYTIYSKEICRKYSALTVTASTFIVGLITFTPLAAGEAFIFYRLPVWNLTSILGLLFMAVFSLLAAYFLYEWGLRRIEAGEAAIFGHLQPLFTFPAAFILLGETLNPKLLPGLLLATIGVVIATSEKLRIHSVPRKRAKMSCRT